MVRVRTEVGHITRNEFVQLGKLGAVEALCLGESCGVASSQLPCASHISNVFLHVHWWSAGARWYCARQMSSDKMRKGISTLKARRGSMATCRRPQTCRRCSAGVHLPRGAAGGDGDVTMWPWPMKSTYWNLLKFIKIHYHHFKANSKYSNSFCHEEFAGARRASSRWLLEVGSGPRGFHHNFYPSETLDLSWLSRTWQILTALSLDFWVSEFGILRQVFTRQGLPCSFCDHARSMEALFGEVSMPLDVLPMRWFFANFGTGDLVRHCEMWRKMIWS